MRAFAQKHRLFLCSVAALLWIAAQMRVVTEAGGVLLQEAVSACCIVLMVAAIFPDSLRIRNRSAAGKSSAGKEKRRLAAGLTLLFAAGVLGGVFLAFALRAADPKSIAGLAPIEGLPAAGVSACAFAIVLVAMGALFEEGLFRVLVINALVPLWEKKRHAFLKAACVSALLFALLHAASATFDIAMAMACPVYEKALWSMLRFLQAGLFGLCLAGLFRQTKSIWPLVGAHALFNGAYFGIPASFCSTDILAVMAFAAVPQGGWPLFALAGSVIPLIAASLCFLEKIMHDE